jgi:hypothetical protein
MQTVTLSGFPEIARLIPRCVGYKKRKAFIQSSTQKTLSHTYWDGGSRSSYIVVNIATGQVLYDTYAGLPPQFGGTAPVVEIDNDIAIIETGVFCGKPATASVFVSPENYNKLLKLV